MCEIALPPALDTGESYGKISWSVRGIYEATWGRFDGNPSTMFGPPSQAYPEMVKLAGGPDAVAQRAADLASTDPLLALSYFTPSVSSNHATSAVWAFCASLSRKPWPAPGSVMKFDLILFSCSA
jgi:hypothetical protein